SNKSRSHIVKILIWCTNAKISHGGRRLLSNLILSLGHNTEVTSITVVCSPLLKLTESLEATPIPQDKIQIHYYTGSLTSDIGKAFVAECDLLYFNWLHGENSNELAQITKPKIASFQDTIFFDFGLSDNTNIIKTLYYETERKLMNVDKLI